MFACVGFVCVSARIHIYQPLRSGRIWHKVNFFKRSLTGLNSELSFSYTSCLTNAEEPSLPYYFTHSWRENNWIHTFPKGISAMWNAIECMYVYLCMFIYACMRVLGLYESICVCLCACMCLCFFFFLHVCMCAYVFMWVGMCLYFYAYVCVHVY